MKRRRFLQLGTIALAGAATASYMRFFEPEWLELTEKTLNLHTPLAHPLRVLHLSDLHASNVVSLDYLERAIQRSLTLKPDLICLTGDYITTAIDNFARYQSILKQLSDYAPTVACLGNHDGGDWLAGHGGYNSSAEVLVLLQASGVQCLQNTGQQFQLGTQALYIIGFNDIWNEHADWEAVFKAAPTEQPILVLLHNPDGRGFVEPFAWDVMLSGHTHGGQLVVPFLDYAPFAPVVDKYSVSGLKQDEKGRYLHITRGLGNLHGLRFNCRPEASLLRLV